MQKILITVFIIVSIVKLNAQIDTTLREYFPLEIGNYWEYRDMLFETWIIEAIKDTIMPNGKTYTVVKDSTDWSGGTIFYYYYRMDDSMKVWEYVGSGRPGNCDSEYLTFDLTLPDSTIWTTCRSTNNPFPEHNFPALLWTIQKYYSTLNLLTTSKTFSGAVVDPITGDTCYCGSFYFTHYELAKGIGLAYRAAELGNAIFITGAIINGVQYGTITNVDDKDHNLKDGEFYLSQNYPNPFNPVTVISYEVTDETIVQLKIYDILGREVAELVNETKLPGTYQVNFDANDLSSGVYIYRIVASRNERILFTNTKQMILIK